HTLFLQKNRIYHLLQPYAEALSQAQFLLFCIPHLEKWSGQSADCHHEKTIFHQKKADGDGTDFLLLTGSRLLCTAAVIYCHVQKYYHYVPFRGNIPLPDAVTYQARSEEHTSELQSRFGS